MSEFTDAEMKTMLGNFRPVAEPAGSEPVCPACGGRGRIVWVHNEALTPAVRENSCHRCRPRKHGGGRRKKSPTARAAGSAFWRDRNETPRRKGWYITRREDGHVSWRAWGKGAWWKQIKGGWIQWFDGDGAAMRFDWQPRSRQSIDLDNDKLPDLANPDYPTGVK